MEHNLPDYDFELRFYVPLETKQTIAETFFPASFLASTVLKKLNSTQQKQTFVQNTKILQNKHKKLKPVLVNSYDLRLRNGACLILQLPRPTRSHNCRSTALLLMCALQKHVNTSYSLAVHTTVQNSRVITFQQNA